MKISLAPANKLNWWAYLGLITAGVLITLGTSRAFSRGANDFSVFYEAWRLVWNGQGKVIYQQGPDRYLYCPGFAWLFAPFALFPKNLVLAAWCLAKAFLIGLIVRKFAVWVRGTTPFIAAGISAWGIAMVGRPLLIDFEYGQINLLILGIAVWALLGHFDSKQSAQVDFLRGVLLAWIAATKIYPLPLILVPWFLINGISQLKIRMERLGILIGIFSIIAIPLLSLDFQEWIVLMSEWKTALVAKGLPLESHNQSFVALLYHYLSGMPTQVISEGAKHLEFGIPWLTVDQISLLSLFWTFATSSYILGWIISGSNKSPAKFISILIGLIILPSHLVWKPYFVMAMPLGILISQRLVLCKNFYYSAFVLMLFLALNFTGFDFVGHLWGPYFEAGSVLLLVHIAMLTLVGLERDLPHRLGHVGQG